ncbi:DHA2 family efflux MFS transporter permease subunit [Sinosporangium siamense]|nr:DHA2 family efflux MFS transporter permease subunit [Sinosporangium siamense]
MDKHTPRGASADRATAGGTAPRDTAGTPGGRPATDDAATNDSAADDSAADDTAPGEAASGSTASDEATPDDTTTDDGAPKDAAADNTAPDRTAPGRSARDAAVTRLGAAVVAGSVAPMLDMTMVTVALADLTRSLGAPVAVLQWTGTAYLLAIAAVIPVTGRLAERYGSRTVWTASLAAFLAGSVLCGLAWSAGSLIVFRVLQGLGGGMIVPLGMTILAQAVPRERLGRAMSAAAVPGQLAPLAGPLLGGLLVDGAGWRWIFLVNVPVCLIALILAWWAIPADPPRERTGPRPDLIGLALLPPAFALIVYGLSAASGGPAVLGVALLAGFAVHALRASAPLIDLWLFAHRSFAAASATAFLARWSIFGAMVLIPLYHQEVRGHDALGAGLLLVPQSLGTMLALPYVGRITDRVGARPVVLAGVAVGTAAAFLHSLPGVHDWVLGGALLLWGAGVAAVAVPVSAAAYNGLERAAIPGATSALATVQTVGASAGGALLAAAFASDPAGAFRWVAVFSALTLLPALLLPLRR